MFDPFFLSSNLFNFFFINLFFYLFTSEYMRVQVCLLTLLWIDQLWEKLDKKLHPKKFSGLIVLWRKKDQKSVLNSET